MGKERETTVFHRNATHEGHMGTEACQRRTKCRYGLDVSSPWKEELFACVGGEGVDECGREWVTSPSECFWLGKWKVIVLEDEFLS